MLNPSSLSSFSSSKSSSDVCAANALRNHQLSPHTCAAFKAKPGESIPVINAGSVSTDIPPGQKSTGVVTIRVSQGNQPQLYQLNFGNSQIGRASCRETV